jgi:hypothetical protein
MESKALNTDKEGFVFSKILFIDETNQKKVWILRCPILNLGAKASLTVKRKHTNLLVINNSV